MAPSTRMFPTIRPVLTLLSLTAVVSGLASCAPPILMRNPQTSEIAQCYAAGDIIRRWHDRDVCVEKYQQLGWVRADGDR